MYFIRILNIAKANNMLTIENNIFDFTVPLAEWSACLTTNHEVASSIPGTSTILKVD